MRVLTKFLSVGLLATLFHTQGALAQLLWDQPLPSFGSAVTSWCSPCAGGFRTFGSFSLANTSSIDSFTFYILDYKSNFQDVNVSIWNADLSSQLYSLDFTPETYVKGPPVGDRRRYSVTTALPNWQLAAGNYFISAYGIHGSMMAWGTDFRESDDLQLWGATPSSGVLSNKRYVGFSLSGTSNITSTVPVPAAAWLLGSAVLGLAGLGRRKSLPM